MVLCVLAIVLPRHFLDLDIFDRLKIEALQLGTALDNSPGSDSISDPGSLGALKHWVRIPRGLIRSILSYRVTLIGIT